MEFHRPLFLTVFLPLLLILYGLIPRRLKNPLLLLASLFFYGWSEPLFVVVLLLTTLLDFILVRAMARCEQVPQRRLLLLVSLSVNLSLLVWFKYQVFFSGLFQSSTHTLVDALFMTGIPLGISFYTFETITYVVDVYRRDQVPLKRFSDYLLYILLFPKLLSGPIVRYGEIADQLQDRAASETAANWLSGFGRVCIGLAKKVLIADQLAMYYGHHTLQVVDPATLSAGAAWLALLSSALQIYFDFSGYCDIAIGLGRMLGFRFPENFMNPLLSASTTELWKRWHITLGNWMRQYLYFPLGGNRKGEIRTLMNLLLVFTVSGIWHGGSWNFLLWGLYNGILLLLERLIPWRLPRFLGVIITVSLLVWGMSLFSLTDLDRLWAFQKALFGGNTAVVAQLPYTEFWLPFALAMVFSFFACTPQTRRLQELVFTGTPRLGGQVALTLMSIVLFILVLSYSTAAGFTSFIYFRF